MLYFVRPCLTTSAGTYNVAGRHNSLNVYLIAIILFYCICKANPTALTGESGVFCFISLNIRHIGK
jgi:hypothetical protein